MNYSLPQMLFQECHKYCVDTEISPAWTDAQVACISNCQDKTFKAFDLYMEVAQRVSARRNARHYVDISKFTGMEVEHKHDTDNRVLQVSSLHSNPFLSEPFQK